MTFEVDGEGVVQTPSPPEENAVSSTPDEFTARVERIVAMMQEDPAIAQRILAELYVQVSEAATMMRAMQDDFGKLGPGGILKMLRGKG